MLLPFILSSCNDQGCIEADDFGEYQSQTIDVVANANQDLCKYDTTLSIADPSQGMGLKDCLLVDAVTITDESNVTQQTKEGGCNGKQVNSSGQYISSTSGATTNDKNLALPLDSTHLNLCITQCITKCNGGSSADSSSPSAEPNWKSTDKRDASKNFGVQIFPGAQIKVSAVGSVTLSNSANYNPIYVATDGVDAQGMPQNYKDPIWATNSIFDTTAGQNISLKFSGSWMRPGAGATSGETPSYYYSNAKVGGGAQGIKTIGADSVSSYNGGRTLVAYVIPHPEGYSFNYAQNSESSGTLGVPLLPKPETWTCDYDATKSFAGDAATFPNFLENNCTNKENGYSTLSYPYPASVDSAVKSNPLFVISSSKASEGLGYYGGPIRWTGDGTVDAAGAVFGLGYSKGFTTVSDGMYSIPDNSSSFVNSNGITLPQAFASTSLAIPASAPGISITNNDDTLSYMIFVRAQNAACATSNSANNLLTAKLLSANGDTIFDNVKLPLTNGGWGEPYAPASRITVGPGQTINLTSFAGCTTSGSIAVKFVAFKDIEIKQSGFVRFTTLNASGTCRLNGRIINPKETDSTIRENNNPNFYEYDNFTTSPSIDPLDNLTVNGLFSSSSWSNNVFVRKGQVIRLSPISWNGNVTIAGSSTVTRQCGIGMVMQITPRPAILCKGTASEGTTNPSPNCLQDLDSSGNLIGCKAVAKECNDSSNRANYCPFTACQSLMNCTPGTNQNNYQKTCTTPTDQTSSAECLSQLSKLSAAEQTNFKSSCGNNNCSRLMNQNAQLPAKISQQLDQCYDLEKYVGRVADLGTDGLTLVNGAAKLSSFNGYYGNFEDFTQTNSTDIVGSVKNTVFQSNNLTYFPINGRLKFFFATNNGDFRNLDTTYSTTKTGTPVSFNYSNTSTPRGSGYTGSNGFKISFDGTLQFNNGQWLEAMLCRETDGTHCTAKKLNFDSSDSYDRAITAQPHLVELENPLVANATPQLKSIANYKFDAYGTLTRVTNPVTNDCTLDGQGVDTESNVTFYCHTYLNSSKTYIYDSSKKTAFSDSDYSEINKLRLTFKIKDPEQSNCTIPNPSAGESSAGVRINNPAYVQSSCSTTADCLLSSDGVLNTNCGKNDSDSKVICNGKKDSANNCIAVTPENFDGYIDNSKCVSNSSNQGQICGANEVPSVSATTNKCTKQFYCGNLYANNSGKYTVTVTVANPPGSNISNIISGVITPIIEVMDGKIVSSDANGKVTRTVGQSQRIYTLLVQDSRYQAILSISMSMMIMFYGLTYLMGMTDLKSSDLINRCIKIGLIYLFASPTGWTWFNMFVVNWFKGGTDYLAFVMASSFDDSPEISQALASNNYYDKSVLFSSADKVFGMFFSQAVQKKISALLFASIFGFVYLFIIYSAFMLYVYSVGFAVLYYLTAQIFVSILFTLGPIFFIFTLFNQTKEMFSTWLNQLIGFSLQQIFLLTTLSFFNMMMYEVVKMSLGYRICWDEVWSINIITRISLLSFWTIAALPPRTNNAKPVGDIGHPEGIPSLFSILFIWVVASLMRNFIDFMTNLGTSIGGGSLKATDLSKGISSAITSAGAYVSEKANDIKKATIGEPLKRLDAALFDSGEHAEAERKEREKKNRQDALSKDGLRQAGNDAVSKYKRENGAELANMDPKEREKKLEEVRNSAKKEEAKKRGISEKEFERLEKDKGLKYEGSNLGGAALQAMRQGMGYGGGSLFTSMGDEKVNSKFSFGEAKAAMSKMSPEERKNFIDKAKDNSIAVGKSVSQQVLSPVNAAAGLAKSAASGAMGLGSDIKNAVTKGNFSFSSSMKNASQTIGGAKDSLINAAKKIGGSAANAAGFNEYAAAEKRLQERGDINRMAFGSILRSPEEKKKINEEMLKHREATKATMGNKNDAMALTKLDQARKGLDKQDERSDVGSSITGKLFGAGGLEHMMSSQLEKLGLKSSSGSEDKNAPDALMNNAEKSLSSSLEAVKNSPELQKNAEEKSHLTNMRSAAQSVSNTLQKIKAVEDQTKPKGPFSKIASAITGKKNTPLSREEADKQIKGIIENDIAQNSDVKRYFADASKMSNLREKQNAAKDDTEKAAVQKDMDAITGKDGYIESGDGRGLENANAMYQTADQRIAEIDEQSANLKEMSEAVGDTKNEKGEVTSKGSVDTFKAVMNSQATKDTIAAYDKLSTITKATGGFGASAEDKKTISDYNKIQEMRKDFKALGSLSNDDMKVKKGMGGTLGNAAKAIGLNKFAGTSKAAAKHKEFAEKYKDLAKDEEKKPENTSVERNDLPVNSVPEVDTQKPETDNPNIDPDLTPKESSELDPEGLANREMTPIEEGNEDEDEDDDGSLTSIPEVDEDDIDDNDEYSEQNEEEVTKEETTKEEKED